VQSDNHLNFVAPVSPGEVDDRGGTAIFVGQTYRLFQQGKATVRAVLGEFYWKVEVGEVVRSRDFVAPPAMLSFETSDNEENISLGLYTLPEAIEAAFGIKNLRRPWSVAPNQPRLRVGRVWMMATACTILLTILNAALRPKTVGATSPWLLIYAIFVILTVPLGASLYAWSFETRRWQNSSLGSDD
jgi:hypothetical protein